MDFVFVNQNPEYVVEENTYSIKKENKSKISVKEQSENIILLLLLTSM